MRFLLAIHYDEAGIPSPESPEAAPLWEAYNGFTQELIDAGAFVAAEALAGSATATCVTGAAGDAVVTDGPVAETKEHLGGIYLIECDDRDAAAAWAARCPGATHGTVEVRPVLEMGRAVEPDVRRAATSSSESTPT